MKSILNKVKQFLKDIWLGFKIAEQNGTYEPQQ
jgi:hypothetical protein